MYSFFSPPPFPSCYLLDVATIIQTELIGATLAPTRVFVLAQFSDYWESEAGI